MRVPVLCRSTAAAFFSSLTWVLAWVTLASTTIAGLSDTAFAQRPSANGPRPVDPGWHAFVGGTAVTAPGESIDNATVVVRDGRIVSVVAEQAPPAGARVWDCKGLTLYPGLIEPYLPVEVPAQEEPHPDDYFNPMVRPQRSGTDGGDLSNDKRRGLLRAGFGAAAISPNDGVFRGKGVVVALRDPELDPQPATVRRNAYQAVSFDRSRDPNSEMGVIALMRQTLLDTRWHQRALAARTTQPADSAPVPPRPALDALADPSQTLWFEADDELQALRAAAVAAEFERPALIVASGMEFRRLGAIKDAGLPLILPVDFPEAPDVTTISASQRVSLRDLLTWEQAPTNPYRVNAAGIPCALTTYRLENPKDFLAKVRTAIENGLDSTRALAMVTTDPARMLGVAQDLGTLTKGRLANITIVEKGTLFSKDAEIHSVWVRGVRTLNKADEPRTLGRWQMAIELTAQADAVLKVDDGSVSVERGEQKERGKKVKQRGRHLDFVIDGKVFGVDGAYRLTAHGEGTSLFGSGLAPDGSLVRWTATRLPDEEDDPDTKKPGDASETDDTGDDVGDVAKAADVAEKDMQPRAPETPAHLRPLAVPLGAYGMLERPAQDNLVFTGATIWTSAATDKGPSLIENGAVWIEGGKIRFVGTVEDLPNLPDGTRIVAVDGKHITPGLIDCHSHTGISRGVNESGQTITAEVRIGDVVDPDDVDWYRQLAGGVTAVQQLHGSANPMGGQSHVAKLRWGAAHPRDLSLQGAPGGIKFALGENPRGANSSRRGDRYPQTRMGVAAILRDRFEAARDYKSEWAVYNKLSAGARARVAAPRQDLELDTLVEILDGKRFVHCHSYRQDEIFMLCRMADEFGFKLGTLQHVLEGYKVADAIVQSAKGASAFSDWWAYKLEVFDAIPHNGALMHDVGVVVSFNSDSDELARRLNTEAGKAVRYGGVEPTEALKFVTLNPAIQLGIEDKVGSLERGKDADLVLWSSTPLSYRARALATWVDGRPLYSIERDAELRAEARTERQRLIQKALLGDSKKGSKDDDKKDDGPKGGGRYWFTRSSDYSCCDARVLQALLDNQLDGQLNNQEVR